ncbi:hypothetical protein K438DRAFT_1880752 [Mycena galopus ATCC 62051]|nr:hypothetical protein K438DRAFT_1880752 [Mycena galopus ATCC 62051]
MSLNQEKGKQRETIEVEDDDARLERIQRVLEKLNTVSPATGRDMENILNTSSSSEPGPVNGASSSDLLARVQAFLPQIQASNAALAEKDPHSLDIENVDGDEKIIQMSLGLGVFEDRSGREGSQSESEDESSVDEDAMEDSDESSTDTDSSSSSEDESSSLESDESGGRKIAPLPKRALLARAIKPLPGGRAGRPEIVVLAETTTEN